MSIPIARLYSIIRFLEKVEEGDSLTDLERKTQLSNVTIQGVVKDLESSAILTTRWRRTSRGRIRECVNISKSAKLVAMHLLQIMEGAEHFFERVLEGDTIDYVTPLTFQMAILHKTLEKIGESLDKGESKELGTLFRRWVCSNERISELKGCEDVVDDLLTVENAAIVRKRDSIYFDPVMFAVFVDFSTGKVKLEDVGTWSSSKKKTSEGEVAAE